MFGKRPAGVPGGREDTLVDESLGVGDAAGYDSAEDDSLYRADADSVVDDGAGGAVFTVPGLGRRSAAGHQRMLSAVLALALLGLVAVVYWTISGTDRAAQQVAATVSR